MKIDYHVGKVLAGSTTTVTSIKPQVAGSTYVVTLSNGHVYKNVPVAWIRKDARVPS